MASNGLGNWTDERVALLRKHWAEGLSASQIAKQLGGVSRNAVIGKVHRLGLAGRAQPDKPKKLRPTPKPYTYTPPVERVQPAPRICTLEPLLEDGAPITVLSLGACVCKFPFGDARDAPVTFCGRPQARGPYCAEHADLAYVPQQKRKSTINADRRRIRNL